MRCTATSKRTGVQCGGKAIPPGTKCHWHGGRSPRGIASPHFQHGRHSRDLPTRLLARYEAARTDPTRLALDDEIALTDARIGELLGKVDTGEAGALWGKLHAAWVEVQRSRHDAAAFAAALNTLGALITAGAQDAAAWQEIADLVQARRRLVESERKHLVEQQQMIRADEAMALITSIALSIKAHVTDPRALAAIQADLTRLLNQPGRVVIDAD